MGARRYAFTFENGSQYYGSVEDKNELVRHLTKAERTSMGAIVSKRLLTDAEWAAWREEVEDILASIACGRTFDSAFQND